MMVSFFNMFFLLHSFFFEYRRWTVQSPSKTLSYGPCLISLLDLPDASVSNNYDVNWR